MKWVHCMRVAVWGFGCVLILTGQAGADFMLGEPVLLEGVINQGPTFASFEGDYHPRLSSDALTLYFASSRPGGQGNEDLWMATRATKEDPWSVPVNLGSPVNSSASDYYPAIAPDGLSLYFYSWRSGGSGKSDIWVTTRASAEGAWGTPVNVGAPVNTGGEDRDPSVSADGLTLYFSSNRKGNWDIYVATRASTSVSWSNAVPLEAPINTEVDERYPHLSADGLTLCLSSNRPAGQGAWDMYVARRSTLDSPWGEPENLGDALNTPYSEYAHCVSADGLEIYLDMSGMLFSATRESTAEPFAEPCPMSSGEFSAQLSPDGLELYFSSDRAGGVGYCDIWVAYRDSLDDPWLEPVNLGPEINSNDWEWAPSLSADGLELYFGSDHGADPDGSNLWVTTRETLDAPWGPAENLGPVVNVSVMDYHPAISPDRLTLVFASLRSPNEGSADLWMTQRASLSEPWGEPVNLGVPINTNRYDQWPSFSRDGRWLFYNSTPSGGPYNEILAVPHLADGSWGVPRSLTRHSHLPVNALGPTLAPDDSMMYFCSTVSEGLGGSDIWQVPLVPLVDLNGDGRVDQADADVLQRHLGQDMPSCDIGPGALGDGVIDEQDLAVLTEYMGTDVNDPALAAHWALDETAGNVAYDSAGFRNGTLIGSPTWQPEAGMVGGALEFDGVEDCVKANYVVNPMVSQFSVFAWVKGGAPGQVIFSQIDGADYLAANADGKLTTTLGPLATREVTPTSLATETVITDGEWHRVGVIWDGAERTLCVDDAEVVSDTQTGLKGSVKQLYIGCGNKASADSFWSGLIDEVRFYDRALKP